MKTKSEIFDFIGTQTGVQVAILEVLIDIRDALILRTLLAPTGNLSFIDKAARSMLSAAVIDAAKAIGKP